jgi:hypothetical protein
MKIPRNFYGKFEEDEYEEQSLRNIIPYYASKFTKK